MCFGTTSDPTMVAPCPGVPTQASCYLLSLVGRECPFQVFKVQDFVHFCVIYVGPHGACQLVLQDSGSIAGWGAPTLKSPSSTSSLTAQIIAQLTSGSLDQLKDLRALVG